MAGDADFISNSGLRRPGTANFVFTTAVFSWLSNGEFPIDASRPEPKDTRVSVSQDDMGSLRLMYLWVMPGILLEVAAALDVLLQSLDGRIFLRRPKLESGWLRTSTMNCMLARRRRSKSPPPALPSGTRPMDISRTKT